MTLTVIGAVFGRTGTLSLKGSLEHLGFGPCYHMVYDLAQGWPPLCRFLDRPVPDEPMPSVNSTAEFRQRFAASDQATPTPSKPDELG